MAKRHTLMASWVLLSLLGACSGQDSTGESPRIPPVPGVPDPGTKVALALPSGVQVLTEQLDAARENTPDELRSSHAVQFEEELGYDPLTSEYLDDILATWGKTEVDAARTQLTRTGFAVQRESFVPSFAFGYSEIYQADLPVFVSADMVLEALFRSHDKILQTLEKQALLPRLESVLGSVRAELVAQADTFEPEVASDLDFFLGVAISLLKGEVDSRESPEVRSFYGAAAKASGEQERVLFGVNRLIDFSQFKPRGHYDGDAALERYFRAMIWLGRTDFRLIETLEDGSQVLRRRQVESVLALRKLFRPDVLADYQLIDRTVTAFVGEHDYMTLEQVDELVAALEAPNSLAQVDDVTLANAILAGGFGEQRIASQVMRRQGGGASTLPLSMSFALFGQRYTVDSHVFSNVVYDRVPNRVVPNPLDVAFAALGNDQALGLLGAELDDQAGFSGELSAIRFLVDSHPTEYWHSSLYTSWMGALRTLSPLVSPPEDLPTVARTETWGRRLLNTQLSSWSQLRHNNVLYVKQSYTSGAACEYPDAYVDPYPEFFKGVVQLAEKAEHLVAELELESAFQEKVQDYFSRVARINITLAEMAELQRTGMPHSAEHLAFINQAVTVGVNCDGTILGHTGWYSELHFDSLQAVEMDPVITDVHTDVGGDLPVSRPPTVLHVATGLPRKMVVTVDSCAGPRAYVGVISSYNELLQEGLVRWTDNEWKEAIYEKKPVVPWLAPVLGD